MKDKLIIHAVETNKGYYISLNPSEIYSNYNRLDHMLFDGVYPKDSFHSCWKIIDKIPTKVSHIESQPNINYRFILKDDSLASDKLPLEIPKYSIGEDKENCEHDKVFVWNEDFAMYRSLYEEISDPQPDIEVENEFEFKIIFKVDEIKQPSEIKYPTNERYVSYTNEKVTDYITNNQVDHQILDKIIFPTILLAQTPSKLSSKDTYNIVREHIKRNINSKVAQVTSDFDFCFEVSKRIGIAEPYPTRVDVSRLSSRKPKYETRWVSSRLVKVFEMTSEQDHYSGYTPIKGFEAKNEDELKNLIDNYLKELIDFINEPLVDCPHCKGKGVIVNKNAQDFNNHN